MRSKDRKGKGWLAATLAGAIGSTGLVLGMSPAVAAGAQIFPVRPGLVPVVVAAAFMLPASAACIWSTMRRATRRVGTLASVGLLAAAVVALLAYANPELISVVRQSVSRL